MVVPTKPDGVDPRYADWLYWFDADILYSFLELDGQTVEDLHERYAPAHLVRHWARDFQIKLPLYALSSLSTLPALFNTRRRSVIPSPWEIQILTKSMYGETSQFLAENFGFLSSTFSQASLERTFPEFFSCLTLISEQALAEDRLYKEPRSTHVTNEAAVLEALGKSHGPITVAQLSEAFSAYLDPGRSDGQAAASIVVGDTPADRLVFWNLHHRYETGLGLTALRIPPSRLEDDEFVRHVQRIMRSRGRADSGGSNATVGLYSCSVPVDELEKIGQSLGTGQHWLKAVPKFLPDHSAIVPRFIEREARFRFGGLFENQLAEGSAEFFGRRAYLPQVVPWHCQGTTAPQELTGGSWMLDVKLERFNDHCRYANKRDIWLLPRRLRLQSTFTLERGSDQRGGQLLRVLRNGLIGVASNFEDAKIAVVAPDDDVALEYAICNSMDWAPFNSTKVPHGRRRFGRAETSDKGRYLIGVLQLFGRLPPAFALLMHAFWRDVLHYLGGVSTEADAEGQRRDLIQVMRNRLGQHNKERLVFEGEQQIDRLAKEALRIGRMINRERRSITFGELKERWETLIAADFLDRGQPADEGDNPRYERELIEGIQYACRCKLIFQGRVMTCSFCLSKNWVGVDDLTQTVSCPVCRHEVASPVSGDWEFRINPFMLEAYRDQGIEAVIWALWRLWNQARESFYFAPSMELWLDRPQSWTERNDIEIDAVAVVDGSVYLVSAKTAGGIATDEIDKLRTVAERMRPDVILLACMGEPTKALRSSAESLRAVTPKGVKVETWTFDRATLETGPFLTG